MTHPIFTIGHSNRSFEDFLALLKESNVEMIVDVRTIPRSRRHPYFAKDALPGLLASHGVSYRHMPQLGGRRSREGLPEPSRNAFWTEGGFRNYADYALTEPFRDGLSELRRLGRETRCAVMCAEAVWWRCHRRIIADYLLASGETVLHILAPGRAAEARLTPQVRMEPGVGLIYEGDQKELRLQVGS